MKVNFNILLFTSSEQDRMDYGRNQIWMAKKLKTFFYNRTFELIQYLIRNPMTIFIKDLM